MSSRLAEPSVYVSDLTSTPRVDTSRAWESLLSGDAPSLAERRANFVEDSAGMSLYIHSSEFLDAFLPLPSTPSKPKPEIPIFSKISGMTSEKEISKEWVSGLRF